MRYYELYETVIRMHSTEGKPFRVFRNPSIKQFQMLMNDDSEYRGLIDSSGENFYVWDAYYATHGDIQDSLPLNGAEIIIHVLRKDFYRTWTREHQEALEQISSFKRYYPN